MLSSVKEYEFNKEKKSEKTEKSEPVQEPPASRRGRSDGESDASDEETEETTDEKEDEVAKARVNSVFRPSAAKPGRPNGVMYVSSLLACKPPPP